MGQIHLALASAKPVGVERAAALKSAEAFMSNAAGRFEELRTKHKALAETAAPIVESREVLTEIRAKTAENDRR